MDLAMLDQLKQELLQATEFSRVLDYFLRHFGEKPEFHNLGERTEHPLLEAVVAQVGQQLLGRAVTADLLLTRLPEHAFIHGGGNLEGRLLTLLYFEDAGVGLLAVVQSLGTGQMHYARFTGRPLQTN